MMPDEDPTWPVCSEHSVAGPNNRMRHFCQWTADYLTQGKDHEDITLGMRYCVPVIPAANIYAEISISPELIAGISAELAIVKPGISDPFSFGEELEVIGLWTKGEGRRIIAQTIGNWISATVPEKCESGTHGFEQEMKLQTSIKNKDDMYQMANNWSLAAYGMCIPCQEYTYSRIAASNVTHSTAGPGVGGSTTVNVTQNFNAASFGLGSNNFNPSRDGQSSRQNATRDALRTRFGK